MLFIGHVLAVALYVVVISITITKRATQSSCNAYISLKSYSILCSRYNNIMNGEPVVQRNQVTF